MEEPLNTKGFHAAVLLLNLHQFCRTEPDHRAAGGGGRGRGGGGGDKAAVICRSVDLTPSPV